MVETPKYVIINDIDAPCPAMVCQWKPGVGYCYLDRSQGKPRFDGMKGDKATPVEAFGIAYEEGPDGVVRFNPSGEPPTATYSDGHPRRWQSHRTVFQYRMLKAKRTAFSAAGGTQT